MAGEANQVSPAVVSGGGEGRKATPPSSLPKPIPNKTIRRRGSKPYKDRRLRRRAGPVCPKCKKRHWRGQPCWAGPENVKRDLPEWRQAKIEKKRRLKAEQQAADLHAMAAAKRNHQPEFIGTPKREGARYIRP